MVSSRVVSNGTASQRRRYPRELSAERGTRSAEARSRVKGWNSMGSRYLRGGAEDGQLTVDDLLEDCGVVEVALWDVGGDVEELAPQLGEG